MDTTMEKAITLLLAHPETAGLGAEFQAEYDRVRKNATYFARSILVALLIVASVGAIFFNRTRADLGSVYVYELDWIVPAFFMWVPILVVICVALAVMTSVRNLYVRYRMCAFLDARSGISPEVAVARQAIETRPVEVLFRTVSVVVPIALVLTGLAWAAIIWLWTTMALNSATSHSKGM